MRKTILSGILSLATLAATVAQASPHIIEFMALDVVALEVDAITPAELAPVPPDIVESVEFEAITPAALHGADHRQAHSDCPAAPHKVKRLTATLIDALRVGDGRPI